MPDIILGSQGQIDVVKRANALWRLLQDDPRFSFQGRSVSLASEQDDTAALVISLARLQGYASCHFVPEADAGAYVSAYETAGLQGTIWNQFWGRDDALHKSRAFLAGFAPPPGLSLRTVTPDTSDDVIWRIGDMSLKAGVLPPPGSAMRGDGPDGVFAYVETATGQVVAAGGAFMAYHRQSLHKDEAFWGMLATDPDWRGRQIACWVGAHAIDETATRFGARGWSSGVKSDNPASQAMCIRLGVGPSGLVYAGATDPEVMGGASITR